MHDPSFFIPSSHYHNAPSYFDNRMRHCINEDYSEDDDDDSTTRLTINLKNIRRQKSACNSSQHCVNKADTIFRRLSKISALTMANGKNFNDSGTILEPSNKEAKMLGAKCVRVQEQQSPFAREDEFLREVDNLNTEIIGNGHTLLSSVQDITSLINNVTDHAHFVGDDGDGNATFFEVTGESMELTIAREEEVMSSEMEEMMSLELDKITSSFTDEVYVYTDI